MANVGDFMACTEKSTFRTWLPSNTPCPGIENTSATFKVPQSRPIEIPVQNWEVALVEAFVENTYKNANPTDIGLIYVYTDIIREQRVGNTLASLLRVLQVGTHEVDEIIHYEFIRPLYCDLAYGHIDTIGIRLRTAAGVPVPFVDNAKVMMVLEYRAKRHLII